jgi:hypothetical protein
MLAARHWEHTIREVMSHAPAQKAWTTVNRVPRHVQQISGLLGRELGVHRQQRHGIALGHLRPFPQSATQNGAGAASPVTSLRKTQADPGKTCCGCGKKGAGGVVPAREGGD